VRIHDEKFINHIFFSHKGTKTLGFLRIVKKNRENKFFGLLCLGVLVAYLLRHKGAKALNQYLQNNSLDSISYEGNIKIDKETKTFTCQSQMA
jgi:hypothetical protein